MSEEKPQEQKQKSSASSPSVDPEVQQMSPATTSEATSGAKAIPVVAYSRPTPPQKGQETGSMIVAKTLAPQLGSDPRHTSQQLIDERKFAVLNEYTATALGYFSYRGAVDNIRFWSHVVGWELVSSQGIDGRGRRDALTAIANASGVSSTSMAEKPNALARNIWDRDWKKKAERSGQVVPEE